MGIYDECCRILWLEIDYLNNEGRNADTFRRNFRSFDWVKVPRVSLAIYVPPSPNFRISSGIKISNYEALEASGLDRKELAQMGAKPYLEQPLTMAFSMPSPPFGNIAVSPGGELIFYDGMMGQITSNLREKLMETLFGITQKDGDRVVKSHCYGSDRPHRRYRASASVGSVYAGQLYGSTL